MSNINWAFWPGWNDSMGRKDFIFNNIFLSLAWFVGMSLFAGYAAAESPLTVALGALLVVGLLYTVCLSVVWMNNRLRDGGLASEGWRIFIIIVSFLSGIVGFLAFVYCLVKPTEDVVIPRQLEEDNASG